MEKSKKFGEILKQLRLDKRENQSEVASFLGVSVQSYSAYESYREPKYDILCKIANRYGVSTDYLLGRTYDRGESCDDLSKKRDFLLTEIEMLQKKLDAAKEALR